MRRENAAAGAILIIIGCLLLVLRYFFDIELFNLGPGDFWPLIILGLGITFEMAFFLTGSKAGLLVPGGILTTIGLLFFFEVSTDWRFSEYTWPVYILAVAIGLFQLYIFGGRAKGLLIPVFILTAVAAVAFAAMVFEGIISIVNFGIIVPVALILVGLLIIFNRKRNNDSW